VFSEIRSKSASTGARTKLEHSHSEAKQHTIDLSRLIDYVALFFSIFILAFMLYLKPGMDRIADLMNYHAFNGWAVLSGEWWNHFHPGFIHHYYINYYDLLHWVILDSFNIEIVLIVMTVIHSTIMVPVYLLSRTLMPDTPKIRSLWIAVLSLSTFHFLIHVGDFQGDILTAIPMMFAIWLLAKTSLKPNPKLAIIAGLLAGLSLAFKLTNAVYAPFFVLFILYWLYKKQIGQAIVLTVSTILSFIILMVPQSLMILSSTDWKNPFFPMYNNIFKSSLAPEDSLSLDHYKVELSKMPKHLLDNMVYFSTNYDLRYALFLIVLIIFVSLFAAKTILKLSTMIRSKNQEHVRNEAPAAAEILQSAQATNNTIPPVLMLLLLGNFTSFIFFSSFYNTPRYAMGIWILFTPLIIITLNYLVSSIIRNNKLANGVNGLSNLAVIFSIFLTVNPLIVMSTNFTPGEKLFEPIKHEEVIKYDAILLPGPGFTTWLTVLHREHIKETGQVWLSTAFNREDAKRADKMLENINLENVAYINAGGSSEFTEANLNTLGFTDAGNCRPLNIDKYDFWYSFYMICDAKYTGEYSYTVNNEHKIDSSFTAEVPYPTGPNAPRIEQWFYR
jgi:hypothetical protein